MIRVRDHTLLNRSGGGGLAVVHHAGLAPGGDPDEVALRGLIGWDEIDMAAGSGFEPHDHADAEIVYYVRRGVIAHRDSLGNQREIRAGDVQIVGAGAGVRLEQRNAGHHPASMVRILMSPRTPGAMSRWARKPFPVEGRDGHWVVMAGGIDNHGALPIIADARVVGASVAAGETLRYDLDPGHSAYLVPWGGAIRIDGVRLRAGDGALLDGQKTFEISADEQTDIILIDVA